MDSNIKIIKYYMIPIIIIIIIALYYYKYYIYREGGLFKKIGKAVKKTASKTASSTTKATNQVANSTTNAANQTAREAEKASKKAAEEAEKAAKKAAEEAEKAAKKAAEELRALQELENMWKKLVSSSSELKSQFTAIEGGVQDVGNQINNSAKELNIIEQFPTTFRNLISKESNRALNAIRQETNRKFSEVTEETKGTFSAMEEDLNVEFNSIFSEITQIGTKLTTIISGFFSQILKILENTMGSIFNDMKQFFEDEFLDSLNVVFDLIKAIFDTMFEIFMNILRIIINIPSCTPLWAMDAVNAVLKTILPDWLKSIIRNLFIPLIEFITSVIKTILGLFGFNFNLGINTDKCYPSFTFFDKFVTIMKDFVDVVNNLFQ